MNQHVYNKGKSTKIAFHELIGYIEDAVNVKEETMVIYLDIQLGCDRGNALKFSHLPRRSYIRYFQLHIFCVSMQAGFPHRILDCNTIRYCFVCISSPYFFTYFLLHMQWSYYPWRFVNLLVRASSGTQRFARTSTWKNVLWSAGGIKFRFVIHLNKLPLPFSPNFYRTVQ